MIELKDQTGKWVRFENYPKRIVCLVPSITELLFDLGLESEVVGITKFCVHPAHWFKSKARVGGTKTVSIGKVAGLSPDLIIANKEENVKEQVEALAENYPVYISDISNLEDALQMIQDIGILTEKTAKADEVIANIQCSFAQLDPSVHRVKACYLIWQDPFITVGGDTFINDMMERCGFQNVFKNHTRYPQTTLVEILKTDLELLLLSSEPYPFKEKHKAGIRAQIAEISNSEASHIIKIQLVDGEFFSWYGSHLQHAALYFRQFQNLLNS